MTGPGGFPGRVVRRLRRALREAGLGPGPSLAAARRLIAASGVFDADWYRARYAPPGDPLEHYLKRGAAQGHDPSPLFWAAWYAARHPGAADTAGGPLTHYLAGQGTGPNPVFDDAYYRTQAGDIGKAVPLVHFIATGAAQGLNPHPLFDTEFYRARYAEAYGARNPLAHFLDTRGGFDPGPHFDADLYRARYPDVAAADINPLAHFLLGGAKDLRDPSLAFCTARYLRRTPAARRSPDNPLVHAISSGAPPETAPDAPSPPAGRSPLTLSAIVPNYNHARFLPERLDSLLAQTEPPDEILFLDDASSDDSLAIAHSYAARAPMPFRIVPSETNSGSPFGQWAKGIALATGDLVWMAESDDRCAPTLVASLKAAFADPSVTLAYAQSRPVGADGQPFGVDYRDYTDDLSLTRWTAPYVAEGRDEAIAALAHRNTIPNASAVLMRRSIIAEPVKALATLRQCGDWALYLACAAAGRIAFTPAILNDHRRHPGALTLTLARALSAFREGLDIRCDALRRFDLPDDTFLAMLAAIAAEYHERMGGYLADPPPLVAHEVFAGAGRLIRDEIARRFRTAPRSLLLIDSADTTAPPNFPTAAEGVTRFLAAVRPAPVEPDWPPLPWIEGGARAWIWSAPALWAGNDAAADPRRIAVLATLAQVLELTAVRGEGAEAVRLAAAVARKLGGAPAAPVTKP